MATQNAPYVKDEKPGKIAWCACGESENQPYCDGSHDRKNTGKRPVIVVIVVSCCCGTHLDDSPWI